MTHEEGASTTGSPATIVECDAAAAAGGRDGGAGGRDLADGPRPRPRRTAARCCASSSVFAAGRRRRRLSRCGWHWYLDKLDAEVGGGPGPADWDAFFAEVGPGYRPGLSRVPEHGHRRARPRPATTTGVSTGSHPPGRRCRRSYRSDEVARDHHHAEHPEHRAGAVVRARPEPSRRPELGDEHRDGAL